MGAGISLLASMFTNLLVDGLHILDHFERGGEIPRRPGPRGSHHSSAPHPRRRPQRDRSRAVGALGDRELRERTEVDAVDLAVEDAGYDDGSARRQSVERLPPTNRVGDEPPTYDVETDDHEHQPEEREEVW